MSLHTREDIPHISKSRGDEPSLEGGQIVRYSESTACVFLDDTAAVISEEAELANESGSGQGSGSVTSVDVSDSDGEVRSDKIIASEKEKAAESLSIETREKLGLRAESDQSSDILIHPALVAEWINWMRNGLYEEEVEDEKKSEAEEAKILEEIMKKFPRKGTLLAEAPKLNPEILAYMSPTAKSRDKHFTLAQNVLGSAMVALARSISLILELEEGEATSSLLHLLGSAGKLLASLHHKQSEMRRAYILPGVDEKYKDLLKKSDITEDLFGKDLFSRLKHTKSMGKVVEDLAPHHPVRKPFRMTGEGNRGSLPRRYRSQPRQAQNRGSQGSLRFKSRQSSLRWNKQMPARQTRPSQYKR